MSLSIIEAECRCLGNDAVVVIEGEDFSEVSGAVAKQAAIDYCVRFGGSFGISSLGSPYPAHLKEGAEIAPAEGKTKFRSKLALLKRF